MKQFDYQAELKKIIDGKQLVQVNLKSDQGQFKVAYIINADNKYLTLIELANDATPFGVSVRLLEDIEMFKVESIYLGEFVKHVSDEFYRLGLKSLENVKQFTFEGFASALEKTNKVAEILTENGDSVIGRVVGHDDGVLAFDEYLEDSEGRLARCYIKFDNIIQISIDIPHLKILARSLADKNL